MDGGKLLFIYCDDFELEVKRTRKKKEKKTQNIDAQSRFRTYRNGLARGEKIKLYETKQ